MNAMSVITVGVTWAFAFVLVAWIWLLDKREARNPKLTTLDKELEWMKNRVAEASAAASVDEMKNNRLDAAIVLLADRVSKLEISKGWERS